MFISSHETIISRCLYQTPSFVLRRCPVHGTLPPPTPQPPLRLALIQLLWLLLLPLILLLLRFAGVKFAHEYIVLMDRAHKLHLDNVMVCGGNDVQSWCRCFFSSSFFLLSPSSLKFSLLLSMWSFVFRHTTCTPRLCRCYESCSHADRHTIESLRQLFRLYQPAILHLQ